MPYVVEVDESGTLMVPKELQGVLRPRTRYSVELQGEVLVLRPEGQERLWASASPEQRAASFVKWASGHQHGPGLLAETLRRDSLYE